MSELKIALILHRNEEAEISEILKNDSIVFFQESSQLKHELPHHPGSNEIQWGQLEENHED